MSMTIGTISGFNELQLHAMLTGQPKEATRLEGWEAFKNFFIKLLNHLPGMSLEDKEKNLRDLYNIIYGEKTAATSDKPHSIETIWPAVKRLINLMEYDQVLAMEFELIPNNSDMDLVIRVDGHTLPEITLSTSTSGMHSSMLASVFYHNMKDKIDAPGVYLLDPEKLTSQGSRVEFTTSAVMETSHGFEVAKALEASRVLVQTPVKEISHLGDQITQLDHYQQLITKLTQLESTPDLEAKSYSEYNQFIDNKLGSLRTHRQQMLESNQRLNHEFVDSLVKKCADDLVQDGLLSKEAINTKMSLLSTLTPHMNTMFNQDDVNVLQLIHSQLELAHQVASLQEQVQSSETFPMEPFSNLQAVMRNTKTGPLATLLNTTFNAIRQTSPLNITSKEFKAQGEALPAGKQKAHLQLNIQDMQTKINGIPDLDRIFSDPRPLLKNVMVVKGYPSPEWAQALSLLAQAGRELEKLPRNSPRTDVLEAYLYNNTKTALNRLKEMIDAGPKAARENEYRKLRDEVYSIGDYGLDGDIMKAVKDIKHQNNFSGKSLLEKLAQPIT